jgi:glucose dehydrogenase
VYFVTGNPTNGCPRGQAFSEAIIEASLGSLRIVNHWAVPHSERRFDTDFGSTPNLFTATVKGKTRKLVGVVNKNGFYYAFDRNAIGAGPVWRMRVANGLLVGSVSISRSLR